MQYTKLTTLAAMLLFGAINYASCLADEEPLAVSLRETRPHEFFGRLHIGKFEDGDESEVSFRIVNEGSQAIRLNKPIGTCGCLKIQVSNSVIPPGGNIDATLSVKIDAKRQAFWRQKLFFDGEKLGDAHGKRTLNRWDAKDLR